MCVPKIQHTARTVTVNRQQTDTKYHISAWQTTKFSFSDSYMKYTRWLPLSRLKFEHIRALLNFLSNNNEWTKCNRVSRMRLRFNCVLFLALSLSLSPFSQSKLFWFCTVYCCCHRRKWIRREKVNRNDLLKRFWTWLRKRKSSRDLNAFNQWGNMSTLYGFAVVVVINVADTFYSLVKCWLCRHRRHCWVLLLSQANDTFTHALQHTGFHPFDYKWSNYLCFGYFGGLKFSFCMITSRLWICCVLNSWLFHTINKNKTPNELRTENIDTSESHWPPVSNGVVLVNCLDKSIDQSLQPII